MRLLDYLRPALRESPEVRAILAGLQGGLDRAWDMLEDARAQLDVSTATWAAALWEEALGLPTEVDRPLDFRRSRVTSKLRGAGTTTVEMLRNVAESFSQGKAEVEEHPERCTFTVHFVDALGLPPNLRDLKAAIEELKPAHLAVEYEAALKTWDDTAKTTWAGASAMTWEELRGGTV